MLVLSVPTLASAVPPESTSNGGAARATFKCQGVRATIVGTRRTDRLIGTRGADVIVGRGGGDVLRGRGGDDLICDNGGGDRVFGGAGDDEIGRGAGNDRLLGNSGDDRLFGGPGRDHCLGGAGRDLVRTCESGTGSDPSTPPENPAAVGDTATVNEDSAVTIPVLANDTDPDGGPKSLASVTQPANGTVQITSGGSAVTYLPDADYCNTPPGTSTDNFTYLLSPGGSVGGVTVRVTCVNDAPRLATSSAPLAYSEGDGAVAVDPALTASDPDSTQFSGATVAVTGNFSASEDELAFLNQNGITGTYDSGTGVLTLTGAASVGAGDRGTAVASLTGVMPAAEAAVQPSPAPAPPAVCAWCEAPLGAEAERLGGRIRCAACGAATTDPWPDEDALRAAYGDWYRPESGRRFAVLGDALLSRTRAAMAGRIDEIAPDGPILDVGAGEGVLIDALRARGREVMGLEPDPRHPDIVDRSIARGRGGVGGRRLLALPRAPAASRRRDPRGVAAADPRRRRRGRRAEQRLAAGQGLRRRVAAPRHPAPPRPPPGALAEGGSARERLRRRAGLTAARRPDRDRLAARPRRRASASTSTSRFAPVAPAAPRSPPGAALAPSPPASPSSRSRLPAARSRSCSAAAAPSTWRRAMPEGGPKVIVVMPARQAAMTLKRTFEAIPLDQVDEVILVDDHSTDETVNLARELPLELVWHPHQVGYGGNQKTCYLQALQHGADVVVMLHPDGQYEPELIPRMVEPIVNGEADMVLGSRLAEPGAALKSGMPRWKYVANKALTGIENRILGTHFTEAHTGYRAYSRELLLGVPFLRNSLDFVFDSELLMQAIHFGFRVEEVPARCRYFKDASSVGFKTASSTGPRRCGPACG